jgi:hypothetical protein
MDVSFITNRVLVMPWRLLQTGRQKGTLKCIDLHGLGDKMLTLPIYREKAVLPGLVQNMVTQTSPGSAPTESGFCLDTGKRMQRFMCSI